MLQKYFWTLYSYNINDSKFFAFWVSIFFTRKYKAKYYRALKLCIKLFDKLRELKFCKVKGFEYVT